MTRNDCTEFRRYLEGLVGDGRRDAAKQAFERHRGELIKAHGKDSHVVVRFDHMAGVPFQFARVEEKPLPLPEEAQSHVRLIF